MNADELKGRAPNEMLRILAERGIKELRPAQEKAIRAGLLDRKNLLVCTPTASGKTLIAELAMMSQLLGKGGERKKAVYLAPLKALVSEKYRDFSRDYGKLVRVSMSTGDLDSKDEFLADSNLILTTPEKLDSLLRHRVRWIQDVGLLVVDEIHLIDDAGRGPVLEVIITLLRKILEDVQILGLSATIGNPGELARWLEAELVEDDWRPVKLREGVLLGNEAEFFDF
jgi:helicase